MPDYKLKDKVVIITGGGSGIGAATAKAFAAEGSKLALTDINESALKEVAESCQKIGLPADKIFLIVVDHSKEEGNIKTISDTIAKFGQLDVLVNNAGIYKGGKVEDSSLKDFDSQISINARAPLQLIQLAIPHLRKTKGNVVNLASLLAVRSIPNFGTYAMSKAAIDSLTRSACSELAADGIRVNAVCPTQVSTNLLKAEFSKEALTKMESRVSPLGYLAKPANIADAVLFLASDSAAFITGVSLPVDGGKNSGF